ncbi:hypothetical protein QBC37DRAFT_399143 [Rhypophila decipiens]|uniref:Uncharacterized protein n=1 Tax=Rhypophila decipiens TaxID=261697 RepID=A0AAN6Y932_9PEZI|nr:hypothetical protein QBC37DRAFT_399143 [Rhypophila decipiens]
MAYSGQGGNNPTGEEEPSDQDNSYGDDGYEYLSQEAGAYSGYDYTAYTQTADTFYPTGSYEPQAQQSYQTSAQYSSPQYSQDQTAWQQSVYGGQADYGSSQAAYSSENSFQRPTTPAAPGSSYSFQSSVQYMMPDSQWTSRHQAGDQYSSDIFTTGSVRPGEDVAPTINFEDDDDDDSMPNYSAPINTQNLPAPAPVSTEEPTQLEYQQAEKNIDQEARRIADKTVREQDEASKKEAQKKSLQKYREKHSWGEIYTREKARLMGGINEECRREHQRLEMERDSLLRQLKRHNPNTCKCDDIHQFLYFTDENKLITREEAFARGWLTAEELASLQCRSPQHSPGRASTGSAKSGSTSGSKRDKSPTGKRSGNGNSGKGKGHKKGGNKDRR